MPALQQWVPLTISVGSVAALWLTGRYNRKGWLISVLLNFSVGLYNIATHQEGFLLSNVVGIGVAVGNYRRWGRMPMKKCTCEVPDERQGVDMKEIIAHILLAGRHRTTVVVGGIHWRYCGHRSHDRKSRCWQWKVYDGYCAEHNGTCWSTCQEPAEEKVDAA